MTRIEHTVRPDAEAYCRPAKISGAHELVIEDGDVDIVLRFVRPESMAAVATIMHAYVVTAGSASRPERVSTGAWDQGSAGQPVGGSGEGGSVATTRALPADPNPYEVLWDQVVADEQGSAGQTGKGDDPYVFTRIIICGAPQFGPMGQPTGIKCTAAAGKAHPADFHRNGITGQRWPRREVAS